jgi:hypothetical protein
MFDIESVERIEGNLGHYLCNMHIGHGCGDPGMSHLLFEREQIEAFLQQMSGKTMTM